MAYKVEKTPQSRIELSVGFCNSLLTGATKISLSVWVMPTVISGTGATANRIFSSLMSAAAASGIILNINNSGANPFLCCQARSAPGDGLQVANATTIVTINNWWHLGAMIDISGDSIKVYINGALETTQAVTFSSGTYAPTGASTADALPIISATSANYMEGRIGEFAIWNADIGDAGFLQLGTHRMAANKVVPQSLVSYFPLQTLPHDVVSGVVGTPTNTPLDAEHPPIYKG